ncbi:MAG: hypothetical protein IJO32_05400 [Bacilli bacterium]|nr:hypothetical protein [Bacilli bacterium]
MDKYDDIINLPHYEPKYHPRMSKYKRSAQFAPFAALVGYDEQVQECSRLTDKRLEIDDELKEKINNKLNKINELIKNSPEVEITYFIPDEKKDGGKYITEIGNVKRIDYINRFIKLTDNKKIILDDVIDIKINE